MGEARGGENNDQRDCRQRTSKWCRIMSDNNIVDKCAASNALIGKDKGKERKSRLHKTLPHTGGAGLCPATDSDCFSDDASYMTE